MTAGGRQALVGAGANLGDRAATLSAAMNRLRTFPGIQSVTASAHYETAPVGVLDQPMFLNLVAGLETTLAPEALLEALLTIEREFGRVRIERWGPRTLDLDLLAFAGETRATESLTLPHPRMLERSFVIEPLREVLALPAFRRPWWDDLNARIATATPQGRVVRLR